MLLQMQLKIAEWRAASAGRGKKASEKVPDQLLQWLKDRAARIDREQTQAMLEWERKNGHKVSERGRSPGSIVEAYNSAN